MLITKYCSCVFVDAEDRVTDTELQGLFQYSLILSNNQAIRMSMSPTNI